MKIKLMTMFLTFTLLIGTLVNSLTNVQAETFDLNNTRAANLQQLQKSYVKQKPITEEQPTAVNPLADLVEMGSVTVLYINFDTGQTMDSVTLKGQVGAPYYAEEKTFHDMKLKDVTGNVNGTYAKESQYVYFSYRSKDSEINDNQNQVAATGAVNVQFVDEAGESIQNATTITGSVGSNYSVDPHNYAVNNYEYVKSDGNLTGQFTNSPQTVTLVYKGKITTGKLTVRYLIENSTMSVASDLVMAGQIGDAYNVSKKDIPGYIYDHVEGQTSGAYTKEPQTITFIYKKDQQVTGQDVTVRYLDEKTNEEIANNVILRGNVGETYTVERLKINGYLFDRIEGSDSGTFTNNKQTVTLYYKSDSNNNSNSDPDKNDANTNHTDTTDHVNSSSTSQPADNLDHNVANNSSGSGVQPTQSSSGAVEPTSNDPATKGSDATLPQTADLREQTTWSLILGIGLMLGIIGRSVWKKVGGGNNGEKCGSNSSITGEDC